MISCDECQKKMVSLFDNEGREGDQALISEHLKTCPECRAFQEDTFRIRQEFVSATVPSPPASLEQEVMREIAADGLQSKTSRPDKAVRPEPWRRKFRRLAWAGGTVGLCLLTLSCLRWFSLTREAAGLRHDLHIAQRDVAFFRAERRLSELQERQEKERKAISALQFRMGELEQRFGQVYSPRTAFLPTEGRSL